MKILKSGFFAFMVIFALLLFSVLKACTPKPSIHEEANASPPDSISYSIFYGDETILREEYEAFLKKVEYRQYEAFLNIHARANASSPDSIPPPFIFYNEEDEAIFLKEDETIYREEYKAFLKKVKYRENEVFLKTLKANLSDSIPIAEYCVIYERKDFCNIHDDIDSSETYDDIADVYLRFEKVLQKQPNVIICKTVDKDIEVDYFWVNKLLIHDSLKTKKIGCGLHFSEEGSYEDFDGNIEYYFTFVEWGFTYEIPIYAKDTNWVDSSKYGKYYAKGKIIPVEWQLKTKCNSSETTYSGKYFIRITGECKK
jgi:hypothetical protein